MIGNHADKTIPSDTGMTRRRMISRAFKTGVGIAVMNSLLRSGVAYAGASQAGPPGPLGGSGALGYVNVKDYGAKGDGHADDTAAIQAAINNANSGSRMFVGNYGGAGVVFFPPGVYRVTKTLAWLTCHLVGLGPIQSSVILWDGPGGGITVANMKSEPYKMIQGLGFQGTAVDRLPATHVDFTNPKTLVDAGVIIRDCQFASTTSHAIKVYAWYNLHWENLRFDGCGAYGAGDGYGIYCVAGPTQFGSSFVVRGLVYDNGSKTAGGKGLIGFDNTVAKSSHLGVARIADGRIEINSKMAAPRAHLMTLIDDGSTTNWLTITLENLFVQNVVGQPHACLVYAKSPNPNQYFNLVTIGCAKSPGDAVVAGSRALGVWNGHSIADPRFGTIP